MIDLHCHIGGAVPAPVLWEILCDQGLATPYENFDAFHRALSAERGEIRNLDDFLRRYFHVTEEIQSSPGAMAISAYQVVAKAHRRGGVRALEVRFNPAKRLRGGVHTLDAILLAALQGLERASLHYGVRTGALLSLGRELPLETNAAIVEAAIRWASRSQSGLASGVIGIDMAGPESERREFDAIWLGEIARMYAAARAAGLRTTYHIGETADSGPDGVERVLESIRPDRIGHGIAVRKADRLQKQRLLTILRERSTCLEICPTVNLVARSAGRITELGAFARSLLRAGIPFCACTDNPYLVHTNARRELDLLSKAAGPDAPAVREAALSGAAAHTFLPPPGNGSGAPSVVSG